MTGEKGKTHEAGIEAAAKAIGGDEWEYPNDKDRFRGEATAAIQAYLTASGMAIVPKEPDNTMKVDGGLKLEAMLFEGDPDFSGVIFEDVKFIYEAMLAAAPDPFKS